ncbi:MAG TPA: SMP-30/gluconolactonase/LRE family protein [Actinomycetota bacterium]|nr:SMP-30/gluconolactonase/LRE family protein [Actinomycetota bacterium]
MQLDRFSTFATGLDHPEGAAWGPDGTIYAGGEAGQIYAIDPGGNHRQIADTGGFLFGITVDGNGAVYGCDMGRGQIVRLGADGVVSAYSSGTTDHPLRVPNFAAFDDEGALYVTDSGEWGADDGLLFRVVPDGTTSVWTDAVPAFPNGCCVTADGDALLVVESRARRVVRVPIEQGGAAGPPCSVADLTGSQPDGIALATDGTMFVGCYRPDRIWRIRPSGAPEVWADDPDGVILNQPANPVFIGAGLDRLLVTSLGGWNLVTADPGVEGLPLRLPKL